MPISTEDAAHNHMIWTLTSGSSRFQNTTFWANLNHSCMREYDWMSAMMGTRERFVSGLTELEYVEGVGVHLYSQADIYKPEETSDAAYGMNIKSLVGICASVWRL